MKRILSFRAETGTLGQETPFVKAVVHAYIFRATAR